MIYYVSINWMLTLTALESSSKTKHVSPWWTCPDTTPSLSCLPSPPMFNVLLSPLPLLPAPESYSDLKGLLQGHPADHQCIILARTQKCNHPSLAVGNKLKLQVSSVQPESQDGIVNWYADVLLGIKIVIWVNCCGFLTSSFRNYLAFCWSMWASWLPGVHRNFPQ